MEEIVIWEVNASIISACELAVTQALKELKLKKLVMVNSEPPLISRNKLNDRLPVLEIRGQYWRLIPGRPFTKEQLVNLFCKIFVAEIKE